MVLVYGELGEILQVYERNQFKPVNVPYSNDMIVACFSFSLYSFKQSFRKQVL